jgi:hypothetical protein
MGIQFSFPIFSASHSLPPSLPLSASTVYIIAHQSISSLPNGGSLEMWILHSQVDPKPIDIGSHIAICRDIWDSGIRSITTATITEVAYCDSTQIVFRMCLSNDEMPSLLAMPVHVADLGIFRRSLYRLMSLHLPSLPGPTPTQAVRRTAPSNAQRGEDRSELEETIRFNTTELLVTAELPTDD